jgi:hypothetical protein
MTTRDARWLTLGALAYPLGLLAARLIFNRSVLP